MDEAAEKEAADKAAAEEAAGAEEKKGVEFDGEFDADRAKRAIENARAEEAKLKERLKEAAVRLAKYDEAEAKEAEAQKSLEQKVAEKDAKIAALQDQISEGAIKTSFVAEASKRGYADPALAFVAAKERGYLGNYDRKSGNVGDHDFEALEESHPTFATEAGRAGDNATGDAGARGARKVDGVSGQFNTSVRRAIQGR